MQAKKARRAHTSAVFIVYMSEVPVVIYLDDMPMRNETIIIRIIIGPNMDTVIIICSPDIIP